MRDVFAIAKFLVVIVIIFSVFITVAAMCAVDYSDDDIMLRCSNSECPLGTWFHPTCLDVTVLPRPDEDWFCSEECRENSRCTYMHRSTFHCHC